ncbi:GntR family transcriptional regulator [Rhodosalinus sp.]|uniref:GntR family transcriptional regulator n=1 Tax=Rhodosalinus sp. TaxID=2047741 RepID=UPI00397C6C8B
MLPAVLLPVLIAACGGPGETEPENEPFDPGNATFRYRPSVEQIHVWMAEPGALLEVELASRALPRAHMALIDRLQTINASVGEAAQRRDAVAYIRSNLEFHRTLYLRAQAPAMLAMAETVWLQMGPTIRRLYTRLKRREAPHYHRLIIAALKAGDEPGLRLAVRSDVTQGLKMLAG